MESFSYPIVTYLNSNLHLNQFQKFYSIGGSKQFCGSCYSQNLTRIGVLKPDHGMGEEKERPSKVSHEDMPLINSPRVMRVPIDDNAKTLYSREEGKEMSFYLGHHPKPHTLTLEKTLYVFYLRSSKAVRAMPWLENTYLSRTRSLPSFSCKHSHTYPIHNLAIHGYLPRRSIPILSKTQLLPAMTSLLLGTNTKASLLLA